MDVLLSAAGRAVDADSRRQMREDSAAVLSKVANSKPVTAAKEATNKYLQKIEANIDMDDVQRRADEYIAKAQAMADDANFRAGLDETPYGPRHAPPASAEDFLSDLRFEELTAKVDTAEKKPESKKAAAEKQSQKSKEYQVYNALSPERLEVLLDDLEESSLASAQKNLHSDTLKQDHSFDRSLAAYKKAIAKQQSSPRYAHLLEKTSSQSFAFDPADLRFNTAEMDAIESALQKKKLKNNRR